jgi:hypothetical protein
LVGLATSGTDKEKEVAMEVLADVVIGNPLNRDAVLAEGGIPVLVGFARDGTDTQKEIAIKVLGLIAFENMTNKEAIREAGGLGVLLELVRGGTDVQKRYATAALIPLAIENPTNQDAILEAGGMAVLAELVRRGKGQLRELAAAALMVFIAPPPDLSRDQEGVHLVIGVLVELMSSGTDTEKLMASKSVCYLAHNSLRYHNAVREAGGIRVLIRLARVGTHIEQRQSATDAIKALALNNPRNQENTWEV